MYVNISEPMIIDSFSSISLLDICNIWKKESTKILELGKNSARACYIS